MNLCDENGIAAWHGNLDYPSHMKLSSLRWARTRQVLVASIAMSAVFCSTAAADPEIHRCPQADGTVAFQATPCAEPVVEPPSPDEPADKPAAAGDDFFDFVNPYDETGEATLVEESPAQVDAPLPEPVSGNRAECEKITRDAIDAIDLEMRRGYSAEDGERYKAELMTLTRQLRACKQL